MVGHTLKLKFVVVSFKIDWKSLSLMMKVQKQFLWFLILAGLQIWFPNAKFEFYEVQFFFKNFIFQNLFAYPLPFKKTIGGCASQQFK